MVVVFGVGWAPVSDQAMVGIQPIGYGLPENLKFIESLRLEPFIPGSSIYDNLVELHWEAGWSRIDGVISNSCNWLDTASAWRIDEYESSSALGTHTFSMDTASACGSRAHWYEI